MPDGVPLTFLWVCATIQPQSKPGKAGGQNDRKQADETVCRFVRAVPPNRECEAALIHISGGCFYFKNEMR